MKCLQYHRSSKILACEIVDVPTIEESDDVIVKVAFAGVCESDLRVIEVCEWVNLKYQVLYLICLVFISFVFNVAAYVIS